MPPRRRSTRLWTAPINISSDEETTAATTKDSPATFESAAPSPLFGTRRSTRTSGSVTPATTLVSDDDESETPLAKKATRGRPAKAAVHEVNSEYERKEDQEGDEEYEPPAKKREVEKGKGKAAARAPPKPAARASKGKGKVAAGKRKRDDDSDDLHGDSAGEEDEEDELEEEVKGKGKGKAKKQYAPLPKSKRKGKAKAVPTSDDEEADELESNAESGLEYDPYLEELSAPSDYDSDASEYVKPEPKRKAAARKSYVISDNSEEEIDDDDYALNSEDDEDMLQEAIEASIISSAAASKRSAQPEASGAGSGAGSSAAARRAEAIQARVDRMKAGDNAGYEVHDDVLDEEEEDVPLASTAAGAKLWKKGGSSSVAEERMKKREERALRKERDKEEMAERRRLVKKLGRKLTNGEKNHIALVRWHPELEDVWGDLKADIPIIEPKKLPQPAGLKLTLLPFQQESLYWMKQQEAGTWKGGMLADEMGMGKTIQTISLLLSDRKKPNLIVAPTVAIMQWKNEIEAHTDGMKVAVWHGASRTKEAKELGKFDVVLTTYSVLESAFRGQHTGRQRKGEKVKQKSIVHAIKWHRVILDEAHNIKERQTNTAKAAFALQSEYKWCLSGTPLQNRVGELYSLVRFIGADPFAYYYCKKSNCKSLSWSFSNKKNCDQCGHSPMQHLCFWNNEILTPIQKYGMDGEGAVAYKKLKILLDRMMLRRTKLERADDLGLPPRIVTVRRDFFSPEEKELYLSLFSDAKRTFSTYVDAGTVLNNYSNIFSLITRMRQMACHPDLVLKSRTGPNAQNVASEDALVCRLCHDVAEEPIKSKCNHIFCRNCISEYLTGSIELQPACPSCHVPISIDIAQPALDEGEEGPVRARQGIIGRLDMDKWRSSSKIEALVEELSNLRREDGTTKSLVFSQFVNFLDLVAWRLQRAGFKICRLEGTMTPAMRDATIKYFMNTPSCTVFLVSLKAGGVALNLTEASRVYLMDSWWNPSVEYQAMDRVHRLGQHRTVEAIKLVIEDSIESRIVQLQEKKSAMVEAAIGKDENAIGRLTPEDLSFLFKL